MFALLIRKIALNLYLQEWISLRAIALVELKAIKKDQRFEGVEEVIKTLILAEDHRFYSHKGFDLLAILRAILSLIAAKGVQGGSTITQQLVRTLISDYRRSISRKCKEVLLAALFDNEFCKQDQAKLYLKVAYFGWRMNGVIQACHRLNISLPISAVEACEIVARLKYPEPQHPSSRLQEKIQARVKHLKTLLDRAYR